MTNGVTTGLVGAHDDSSAERRFRAGQRALIQEFKPRRVPLLARAVTADIVFPLVQDMRAEGGGLLSVVADAGSGKTVLLGHLYELLGSSGPSTPVMVRCDQVLLPESPPTAASAPLTGQLPLATALASESLDQAFGAASGAGRLTAALEQFSGEGRVLLLDTLDLLLSRQWADPLCAYLSELSATGTTIVLTCRPREYSAYCGPLTTLVDEGGHKAVVKSVPALDQQEIVDFTRQYLTAKGIRPAIGEEEFGQRLITISSGGAHVGLRRLLSSPLLLGMVCEIFGGTDGHVPQDLTTSGLYARYWAEKVSSTRLTGSQEAMDERIEDKEALCRYMASLLWRESRTRFQDRLTRNRLTGTAGGGPAGLDTGSARRRAALQELCDDGFLNEVEQGAMPIKVVEFRHQTLAEYAVAHWLVELDDERREFYQRLCSDPAGYGFALPVLRHLLGMEDVLHRLDDVVPELRLDDLGIFRNTAFAVANCGNSAHISGLAQEATGRLDQRIVSLWDALEAVTEPGLDAARAVALGGLRDLPHQQVSASVALFGLLSVRRRPGDDVADLAPGIRAVHARRADWPRRGPTVVRQPDEALQDMLGPALEVGAPVSVETVQAVQEDFEAAGRKVREVYIRLVGTPGTPAGSRNTFLRFLVALPDDVFVPADEGARFVATALLEAEPMAERVLDKLITDTDTFPNSRLAQHTARLLARERPVLRDALWRCLDAGSGAVEVRKRAANVLGDLCSEPDVATEVATWFQSLPLPWDKTYSDEVRAVLYGLGRRVSSFIASPEEKTRLDRLLARTAPPERQRGTDRLLEGTLDRETVRRLSLDEVVVVSAGHAHDVTARQAASRLPQASGNGTVLTAAQWRHLLSSRWSGTRRAALSMLDKLLRQGHRQAKDATPALLGCTGPDATPGERQALYTTFDSWLRAFPDNAEPHRRELQVLLRNAAHSGECAGEPAKAWVALVRTCFECALTSPPAERWEQARTALEVYGTGAASGVLPVRGRGRTLGEMLLVRAVGKGVTTPEELVAFIGKWQCGGQCAAVTACSQTASEGAWNPLLQNLLEEGVLCPEAEALLLQLRETE
ncbi:hypothetical protein [Streptomyces abyssomicinicus]|uniref:hypothetical protein n=1 Tax=Streptomyces abyssomicinicus TaxID=574929 RepID=UPI001250212A|nr:hypothetical protein [Streptomyces abyssomicinicus]